ncbi:MAG: hypothetical protein FWC00_04950 [Firmicutes bacterium]|nr:hypothetical protein [Bacillota bacterium]
MFCVFTSLLLVSLIVFFALFPIKREWIKFRFFVRLKDNEDDETPKRAMKKKRRDGEEIIFDDEEL